jgi:hypothetical protein
MGGSRWAHGDEGVAGNPPVIRLFAASTDGEWRGTSMAEVHSGHADYFSEREGTGDSP